MRHERIGSLALLAYPAKFRSARGEEMLGTLLDAGEDSTGAFVRGCASLIVGGWRERARENARLGARRLVADAFCQAAVLFSVSLLAGLFHPQVGMWPIWAWVLLAAIPVCALLGRDRLGGVCGVVLAGCMLIHGYGAPVGPGAELIGSPGRLWLVDLGLGPLVCFAVMTLKPRVRAHDPRKLIWLIPVVALFLLPQTLVAALFLVGLPLLGIVRLPVDPRLAIASVLLWMDLAVASTVLHVRLGLVTFPVLLLAALITVVRVRTVTRGIRA